jgi:hypothetical protein
MARRKLGLAAVLAVLAVGASAAYSAVPATTRAKQAGDSSVVGAWYVTVYVDGTPKPAPFDTLYLFTRGGGFTRIDGRNNVAGLGVWNENSQGRVSSTFMLFSFDATGKRTGTITAKTLGRVRNGVLTGSFTAAGVDLSGNPLPGFPKTGTYTGSRIVTQAP